MSCLVTYEMGTVIVLCILAVTSLSLGDPVPSAEYDVIVVGLGASGTAAATTLAKAGKKVVALEAQDRIGGRVKTVKWGSGTVEEGAEWIHGTTNSTTYRLALENNVEILPQNLTWSALRSDGSEYDNKIVSDLFNYAMDVQEEPPEVPEALGEFVPRKLQQYVREHYPALLNDTDFLHGFHFFLDQAIQGLESASSWNDVTTSSKYTELEGFQQMSWHRNGYKTLFDILLNRYNNGPGIPNLDIKLSTEVTNIAWSPHESRDVVVTTAGGDTYTAPHVIVTPSLGVLKAKYKTLFTPALPKEKEDAINNISFGVCCKVILRFSEKWWEENHFLAFIWNLKDRKKFSDEDKWATFSYGVTPSMSANDSVSLWFCGERAKKAEATPNDVLQSKVMQLIRTFAGKKYNVPEPIEIMKSTWYTNPFVRGAYSFDGLSTPQHPEARAQLARPLPDGAGAGVARTGLRLLFAGEATERTHFSTVHGALDTGFREARRLLDAQ